MITATTTITNWQKPATNERTIEKKTHVCTSINCWFSAFLLSFQCLFTITILKLPVACTASILITVHTQMLKVIRFFLFHFLLLLQSSAFGLLATVFLYGLYCVPSKKFIVYKLFIIVQFVVSQFFHPFLAALHFIIMLNAHFFLFSLFFFSVIEQFSNSIFKFQRISNCDYDKYIHLVCISCSPKFIHRISKRGR